MAADPSLPGHRMKLPFMLLSSHIDQILAKDPLYFEIGLEELGSGIAASSFTASREYRNHRLVQASFPMGETVVPVGLYSDGVAIGKDHYNDSFYMWYTFFLAPTVATSMERAIQICVHHISQIRGYN